MPADLTATVTAVGLTVQIDVLGIGWGLGAFPWSLPWGDHPLVRKG